MTHKTFETGVFYFSCLFLLSQRVSPGRILYLAFPQFSSMQVMACVKEELKEYGHELWITYPEYLSDHPILKDKDIHFIKLKNLGDINVDETFVKPCADLYLNPQDIPIDPHPLNRFQDFIRGSISDKFPRIYLQEIQRHINDLVLGDDELLETLRKLNFDLVVVDGVAGLPYSVIPYRLGLPFCSIGVFQYAWHSGTPTLPSFVPIPALGSTDNMTFKQRLISLLVHFALTTVPPYTSEDIVTKFATEKPPLTMSQLMTKAKMWFIVQDEVADFPRPLMPNSKLVGGICSKDAKALPKEFQDFFDRSKNGVILVSFGGSIKKLPEHIFHKLYEAFRKTKYDFIWRTNKQLGNTSNIMATNWLPQNDILGNRKTKLFITHGGANSQYEAIYHGVPMLGVPFFGDQPYNCRRLVRHGYGLELDIHEATANDFIKAINTIIETPSFNENIIRASEIFRNRPVTPREEVAYWMDYLIKHGDTYIRSVGLDLPWYQYLCLDVLLFIVVVLVLLLIVCVKSVVCCCRCCCKSKKERQKQD